MIENFRYRSKWEDFEKAVDTARKLVDSGQAFWMVGFLDEFNMCLAEGVSIEEGMSKIITDEVIYLMRWYLAHKFYGLKTDENEIRSVLLAGAEFNMNGDELDSSVKMVQNKLELLIDAFDTERLTVRFKMKQEAVNLKLDEFKYNICKTSLPGGGSTDFAVVNMVCKKKLCGVEQGIERLLLANAQGESVTFICDEEDIDLWINELTEMKQKLKGER